MNQLISIHASEKEATKGKLCIDKEYLISIHASEKEATQKYVII